MVYLCFNRFAVLSFVAGPHLYQAIATDSTYLVFVIILLFIAGVMLNYLGVRQLRIEYVCAAACMDRLRTPQGFKSLLTDTPAGVFHRHVPRPWKYRSL